VDNTKLGLTKTKITARQQTNTDRSVDSGNTYRTFVNAAFQEVGKPKQCSNSQNISLHISVNVSTTVKFKFRRHGRQSAAEIRRWHRHLPCPAENYTHINLLHKEHMTFHYSTTLSAVRHSS